MTKTVRNVMIDANSTARAFIFSCAGSRVGRDASTSARPRLTAPRVRPPHTITCPSLKVRP